MIYLSRKVFSQNYQPKDTIQNVINRTIQHVSKNTLLGLISKILEIDEFAIFIDESIHPVGVISPEQLIDFIATGDESKNQKS